MNEKYVYRVENKQGEGPYRAWYTPEMPYAFESRELRPGPVTDKVPDGGFGPYRVFGFLTPTHLKRWFGDPELRSFLAEAGYYVARYKVSKRYIWKGLHQVAFREDKAKRLSVKKITPDRLPFVRRSRNESIQSTAGYVGNEIPTQN